MFYYLFIYMKIYVGECFCLDEGIEELSVV